MNQTELAIVLKTVAYEDKHRIVTAISENHGKVTAMAKNAIGSRRFGANLEPFSASVWRWTDKRDYSQQFESKMVFLESCEPKRAFEGIRKSFENLSIASVAAELVLKTAPPWTPCPELFKLHANFLALLDENPKTAPTVQLTLILGFLLKILHFHGVNPGLHSCKHCKKPLEVLLDHESLFALIENAGFSCCERPKHTGRLDLSFLEISPIALKVLGALFQNPIRKSIELGQVLESVPMEALSGALLYLKHMLYFHVSSLGSTELKSLTVFESVFLPGLKTQASPGKSSPKLDLFEMV